ncbi:hypothetical protein [Gorillibacterium massiliense]|uniref:hypothetical protein n=1 Tax=Gorillibacterium massiliense TaxID=1280390 RepID=UPI0012DF24B4|nr:hypothetical protein [Gorillibacterium massiliense]
MSNVVFWLLSIFFLPFAFLIPLLAFFSHRNLSFHRIKDWKLLGNVFLLYFAFGMMITFFGDVEGSRTPVAIVFAVVFLLPGVLCYIRSHRLENILISRYHTYAHLLLNERMRSIRSVAERTGLRRKVVTNDLIRMMYTGVFDDYHMSIEGDNITLRDGNEANDDVDVDVDVDVNVDLATSINNLVTASLNAAFGGGQAVATKEIPQTKPKLQPKKVECGGCGSSSLLKPGQATSCEYCGAPISYS